MDPRIRQRDIIMREEVSAERLRMTDQGYINIHLNTPGYRTYRPAWKMIAWHVTAGSGSGEESRTLNDRKRRVLDSLTDAQKDANTTRGSTPGLIDPALGEISGNRVALPDLVLRKRGRRRANVNVSNAPATQLAQSAQVLQTPQAPQAPPHAPQAPQTSHLYQNQQFPQSSRASSANIATAQFPVASARMGSSSQNFANNAAVPVLQSPACNFEGRQLTWRSRDRMILEDTQMHKPATQPLCHHHPFLINLGTEGPLILKSLVHIQIHHTPPTGNQSLMISKPVLWKWRTLRRRRRTIMCPDPNLNS